MSEITNRASDLLGLAEGLNIDTEKPEGKLISEMLKVMSDMAKEIEAIDDEQAFTADKVDELEDVIDMIGDEVFNSDCDCDDYDDDEVYTLKCDNCGEEIDFTADDLDDLASGDFVCPECGNTIDLEFDECDCDCDDCH